MYIKVLDEELNTQELKNRLRQGHGAEIEYELIAVLESVGRLVDAVTANGSKDLPAKSVSVPMSRYSAVLDALEELNDGLTE